MILTQQQHKDFGFSLPEVLAIVVILGIFTSLAVPSFLSWVNSKRIEDVAKQVEGALKEAQAGAIRTSQSCSLTINATSVTATPTNCLSTGSRDLSKVSGSNNLSSVAVVAKNNLQITFSPKGSTASSNTFVFYHPNQTQGMRCLAVSAGIGMIRVGEFRGTHPPTATQADANDCYAS